MAVVYACLRKCFPKRWQKGRGKSTGRNLKKARRDTPAKKLFETKILVPIHETVPATTLRKGDVVLVESGDFVPMDGEII